MMKYIAKYTIGLGFAIAFFFLCCIIEILVVSIYTVWNFKLPKVGQDIDIFYLDAFNIEVGEPIKIALEGFELLFKK